MDLSSFSIIHVFWSELRKRKILKKHRIVANSWNPLITLYFGDKLEKYNIEPLKKNLVGQKIIWQYWGQGFDSIDLPEVVSIGIKSIDKFKGEYQIVRLSDKTIKDYVEIPQFVFDKLKANPQFNRTFFSDLLRLALLKTYGGVWLDATILLTGPIPYKLASYPYFLFQRDDNEPDKKKWMDSYAYYWGWDKRFKVKMLNSIMFSQNNNSLITVMFDLILNYWKTQDDIKDYFFFQILYQQLIEGVMNDQQCPIVSDTLPHLLQTKINGGHVGLSYDEILERTSIHKLSYFEKSGANEFKRFCNEYLIS